MDDSRMTYVCAACDTTAVVREAWAAWDVATQAWRLEELFDFAFCQQCHRRTRLEARPATG
ncbi:MAG: hypothetical protein CVT77_09240 [Alphaproteobacteria bacterium HGW-Alphaproteobacteria-16]|nr:MAG: hypothetical protein CVT77_09240 [Alphaproteobacteria bacterium HGW-Alphaproteobacteria-16]